MGEQIGLHIVLDAVEPFVDGDGSVVGQHGFEFVGGGLIVGLSRGRVGRRQRPERVAGELFDFQSPTVGIRDEIANPIRTAGNEGRGETHIDPADARLGVAVGGGQKGVKIVAIVAAGIQDNGIGHPPDPERPLMRMGRRRYEPSQHAK